jgi:hypothetical protein
VIAIEKYSKTYLKEFSLYFVCVINERKKRYKNKVYSYYYLKYREGEKVLNKHIIKKELQVILKKLELRKKYEKEIQSYKKKIAYLNKITSAGKGRVHAHHS